jgi:hypothetical protein
MHDSLIPKEWKPALGMKRGLSLRGACYRLRSTNSKDALSRGELAANATSFSTDSHGQFEKWLKFL